MSWTDADIAGDVKKKDQAWTDADVLAKAEPSIAQKIAANPITRFAVGAASPILGIAEMIPGPTGAAMRRSNETLKQMTEAGKEGYGAAMNVAGSAADIAGNVLSPASLGLMKALPAAGSLVGKVAQGAGSGAVSSLANMQGDAGAEQRLGNAAIAGSVGGAIPVGVATAGKVGEFVGNVTGPMRESWRTNQGRKFIEDFLGVGSENGSRARVIDAISKASPIATGSPVTVADAIAAQTMGGSQKFGSGLVAAQEALSKQGARGIADTAKTIAAQQDAAQAGEIARIARGPVEMEAAKNARDLTALPIMRQSIENANTAGKLLPKLEEKAQGLGYAVDRSQYAAAGKNSVGADGKPLQDAALLYKEGSDFAQRQAQSLADYGLTPLKSNAISSNIEALKKAEGNVTNTNLQKVMSEFQNLLKSATDANGVISAKELHTIRKDAGDLVKRSVGESNATNTKVVGGLTKDVQRFIDDAIVGAGGTRWPEFLKTYGDMSRPIERMQVGKTLNDALVGGTGNLRQAPFANAVRTVSDAVSKNTNRPMIDSLTLGERDAVNRVTSEIMRDVERGSLGKGTDVGHLFEIADKTKGAVSIPSMLSRPATIANWVMKKAGHGADEKIAQDMGNLMLTDPAGFSKKYLENVPKAERQLLLEEVMKRIPIGAGVATGAMVNK